MEPAAAARPQLEDEQWERLALEERAWRVKFQRVGRVAMVCGLVGLCVMWLRNGVGFDASAYCALYAFVFAFRFRAKLDGERSRVYSEVIPWLRWPLIAVSAAGAVASLLWSPATGFLYWSFPVVLVLILTALVSRPHVAWRVDG